MFSPILTHALQDLLSDSEIYDNLKLLLGSLEPYLIDLKKATWKSTKGKEIQLKLFWISTEFLLKSSFYSLHLR